MLLSDKRVAVLGTGSIGARHLRVLRQLGISPLAVPIRGARLMELDQQGWSCATDLREARARGATLAVIATNSSRHVADAEEALSLGLHVLVEKPMGLSLSQANHLSQSANQRGLVLCVGCPLRFDPGLQAFREQLLGVGAVHAVRIECRSYLPDWRPGSDYRAAYSAQADEGGVLRDLIHEIDYAIWIFGFPTRVFGVLRNFGRLGIQSEEVAEGQWAAPSGAFISVGLDYLSRDPRRFLNASGANGEIKYDFITRTLSLVQSGQSKEWLFAPDRDKMYALQLQEFLGITEGRPARHIATAEEGLRALAVCDAWRESAATQCMSNVAL